MPDNSPLRAEIVASITQGRLQLHVSLRQMQEIVSRVRETMAESRELIARADKFLARK